MSDRIELLNSLLKFDRPLGQIVNSLNSFRWDSDSPLVILETQHIAKVLRRYLGGELSASDVEDWANAIECREDIGYERDIEEILSEVIFAIANPLLTRPLSHHDAKKWIEQLERSTPVTAS